MSIIFCSTLVLTLIVSTYSREGVGPGEQDWGYVTVRPKAHMFWWLYHTTAPVNSSTERPLALWLQGGPGGSSTGYGNFEELGPLDLNLNERNYTWVKDMNVLFVDNPVGTGFSYVDEYSVLTRSNQEIAEDLVTFLHGFYKAHPEFATVPLYITTESYGGKMAIDFAILLDKQIKAGNITSNLKAVCLIDSWISPIDSVLTWAPFLLQTGSIDHRGYQVINKSAQKTKQLLDQGKFAEATTQWAYTESVINGATHQINFYNILYPVGNYRTKSAIDADSADRIVKPSEDDYQELALEQLMNGLVRTKLGIDADWGRQSARVFAALRGDFMKPVTNGVEVLLNTTDVQIYVVTGQLDLIVDTPGTVQWVEELKWPNGQAWLNSYRRSFTAKGVIEGYIKKYGNLALYTVLRSGHMVPFDNPNAMAVILEDMTNNYSAK